MKKIKPKSWKEKLEEFDRNGYFLPFVSHQDNIIKELIIQELEKGKKPDRQIKWNNLEIYCYKGPFSAEFKGYEVTAEGIEVGVIRNDEIVNNSELLLKRLKNDGTEGKKIKYGGSIKIKIANIDDRRDLCIESQNYVDALYGYFLVVSDKECTIWPGVKFDIYLNKLNEKGILQGEELYDFTGKLIKLAKECDAGIEIKSVWYNKEGRIYLMGSSHLYPRFRRNEVPEDEEEITKSKIFREKLVKVYEKGKELFGEAFGKNSSSYTQDWPFD